MALTRDFTVAVFVIVGAPPRLLLHPHPKLGLMLPPGGHIEPNELPDEAAVRETLEETGLDVTLIGERAPGFEANAGLPLQLVRPRGIQLETIGPDHEHIDLVYFATPSASGGAPPEALEPFSWYALEEVLSDARFDEEVRAWARLACEEFAASP